MERILEIWRCVGARDSCEEGKHFPPEIISWLFEVHKWNDLHDVSPWGINTNTNLQKYHVIRGTDPSLNKPEQGGIERTIGSSESSFSSPTPLVCLSTVKEFRDFRTLR